ncbi:hypothetical protein SAMN02799616_01982 [Paenibacillus sp. UNC499MF]|nr:hypothetical protein SAMN02799616_01982 [Paenibacillus sp. UNC499MF]
MTQQAFRLLRVNLAEHGPKPRGAAPSLYGPFAQLPMPALPVPLLRLTTVM